MAPKISVAAAVVAVSLSSVAWAAPEDEDSLGRGVARISLMQGDVSVRRGDSGDWVAAAVNAPLVVGDYLFVGPTSRAEVQFDHANFIRVASNSEIRLSQLEHRRFQIQIARGTATFRVLRSSDSDVELSTPSVSVRPAEKGTYRLMVREDGTSEITVRSGEAEVFTPTGSERLRSGRTMEARGTAANPEFQIVAAIQKDEWDRWNEDRDDDLNRSRSYQYVSRDIYGAEDLDRHGSWIYVQPYGWVWSPHVSAGWAPYRHGRWSWVDWYGWTWVSYDPWGWAPYHYGRWFYRNASWCWYPGDIYSRHYWRPALVAFFGWGGYGGGLQVGVGFGRVGWVPLAPYEPYYPWYGRRGYGRGAAYVDRSVTVVNNVNVTNVYRNARFDRAVTIVGADDFRRGRVAPIAARVSDAEFQSANLVRGAVPVVPERESLRWADRESRAVVRPDEGGNSRFFSRRRSDPVDRVSFEEQRRSMEQVTRSVVAADTRSRNAEPEARQDAVRREGGWRRVGDPEPAARTRDSESGWRRFGEPVRGARPEGSRSGWERRQETESGAGGWRSFGEPDQRSEPATRRDRIEPSRPSRQQDDGWRRFGTWREAERERFPSRRDTPEASQPQRRDRGDVFGRQREQTRPEIDRTPDPGREQRPWFGRQDSPRYERRDGGEPVRISPPIVRERSSPRLERGDSAPARGGFERPSGRGSDGGEGGGPARGADGGGRMERGGGRGRDR